MTRVGVKPVLVVGMAVLTAGLLYFTRVSVGGSYVADLLPGFLIVGVGIGFSFVPISIAALAGIRAAEAGLASGLINTSQQIGGALGIAALSTIATTRTKDSLVTGWLYPRHWSTGSARRSWSVRSSRPFGLVAALTLIRRDELASEPVPGLVRSPCSTRPERSLRRTPVSAGAGVRRVPQGRGVDRLRVLALEAVVADPVHLHPSLAHRGAWGRLQPEAVL